MKKAITMILTLALVLVLVGCKKTVLSNENKDYYASINSQELTDSNKMNAIALEDKAIKSIKKALKGNVSYIYSITLEVKEGDRLSIKRCAKGETTEEYAAQDKLSGPVTNLTEDVINVPEYTEFAGSNGSWNDEMSIKVSGTYLIVFAESSSGAKYIALIKA